MAKVAVRIIRTRRRFANYPVILSEMKAVHDKVIKDRFLKEFNDIVANWNTQVRFQSRFTMTGQDMNLYVYPTGSKEAKQIWNWNVQGTPPHRITVKNAKTLAFQWGGVGSYSPKTGAGGTFYGGLGQTTGGQMVYPTSVNHPGTAPRNWPEVIREKLASYYSREVENAWRRALRRM